MLSPPEAAGSQLPTEAQNLSAWEVSPAGDVLSFCISFRFLAAPSDSHFASEGTFGNFEAFEKIIPGGHQKDLFPFFF